MEKCKRCGKRRAWDQHGYCERCHDEIFIENMKKLAGDTSEERGIVRAGIRKGTCRLCSITMPVTKIEKRTGYCQLCIAQLKVDRLNKRLDKLAEEAKGLGLVKDDAAETGNSSSFQARVHGISFREDAVLSILDENKDYSLTKRQIVDSGLEDGKIYKYNMVTAPAELIPEPDNPEDPNAIGVYVYKKKLGYIARGMTARIHKLIRDGRLGLVLAEIGGGPCKYLTDDVVVKDERQFYCKLTITTKAEE